MNTDTQSQSVSATDALPDPAQRTFAWSDMLIIILVAWLGEYAGAIATAAPALVGAWSSHLGADNATAGMLATSGLIGQTSGLIIGVLLVSHWPLARFAWIGLLIAILFDAISIGIDNSDSMFVVRLGQGVGTGLVMAAAINWMGRHQQSIRAFAVFILLQAILPRAFLNLVPLLVPLVGHASVYVGLIVWALSCTLFMRVLSVNGGGAPVGRIADHQRAPLGRRASAVLAMALFNFTAIGTWAFLMRYAESKGLSPGSVLPIIGWSAIFSVLGSWLAFAVNTRLDRRVAIVCSYALLMLNTAAMVILPQTAPIFAAEMFLGGFVASFLLPYMLATQSALDSSGRLPVWGLIGGGCGASLGPMVFGLLSQQYSYATAFAAVAGLGVVGCSALIYAAGHTNKTTATAAFAQA